MTKIDAKAHPKAAAAEAKMIARLKGINTAQLIEMADELNADFHDDEKNIIQNYVLDELETRIDETEFVALMEKLEAAL